MVYSEVSLTREKRYEQADQWFPGTYELYEKSVSIEIILLTDFNNSQVTNLTRLETFIASYEVTNTQNLCILCAAHFRPSCIIYAIKMPSSHVKAAAVITKFGLNAISHQPFSVTPSRRTHYLSNCSIAP
jgi:hypothetical protein